MLSKREADLYVFVMVQKVREYPSEANFIELDRALQSYQVAQVNEISDAFRGTGTDFIDEVMTPKRKLRLQARREERLAMKKYKRTRKLLKAVKKAAEAV